MKPAQGVDAGACLPLVPSIGALCCVVNASLLVRLRRVVRRSCLIFFFFRYFFSPTPVLCSLVAPGADKEGLVQSHPIDKLHMDNRLTEQGVEEVSLFVSGIGRDQNCT